MAIAIRSQYGWNSGGFVPCEKAAAFLFQNRLQLTTGIG
jgi:hypothetical protein